MGPTWGRHDPGGHHLGPMNFAIWVSYYELLVIHSTSVAGKYDTNSWFKINYNVLHGLISGSVVGPSWLAGLFDPECHKRLSKSIMDGGARISPVVPITGPQWWANKNIERHAAHTIVSWSNPKQWVIVHTSDLVMIIRHKWDISIYILSIITRGVGKQKTHSPTCCIIDCIMDNWENMLNLTHSTKHIWQASLWVQCLQKILHNDDNEMLYCTNKRVRSGRQNVSDSLHSS